MNKQELIDYVNKNTEGLDENLNLEVLEGLITAIDNLSSILEKDIKNNSNESSRIKSEIESFREEIRLREVSLARIDEDKSVDGKDYKSCKDLLPKVKDRLKAVELGNEIDSLVAKMPLFEEVLYSRIENHVNKMKEADPFCDEAGYNVDRIYKKIDSFIHPQGTGFVPVDSHWIAVKRGYNDIVISFCESKVKGKHVPLEESSRRFSIIDDAIAKDEERLFR